MALRSMAECPKIDLAVGGDRLPRPHDEPVTDFELCDGEPVFHVSLASSTATSLAPTAARERSASPDPTLGPRLEIPSGQEEGGDSGGHVDVDGSARLRVSTKRIERGAWLVSRQNMAYSDQPVAATMPRETRVSMEDVRWRALRTAAL